MSFETICAILVTEPFNLRPWEIAKLTRRQINRIYFHPRTDDGSIDIHAYSERNQQEPFDYKRAFWESCEDKGMKPEKIQERWDSFQPKVEINGSVQPSNGLHRVIDEGELRSGAGESAGGVGIIACVD